MNAPGSRWNLRFGLKGVLCLTAVIALGARGWTWIDDHLSLRTDLRGTVVTLGDLPAANVKVFAVEKYRDLVALGIEDLDPSKPLPPTEEELTIETKTNRDGRFWFRGLKKNTHYTIRIENEDVVSSPIGVVARKRRQELPAIKAVKGCLLTMQILDVEQNQPELPQFELQVSESSHSLDSLQSYLLPRDGTFAIRLAPGMRNVRIKGAYILEFPRNRWTTPISSITSTFENDRMDYDLVIDRDSGGLTPIFLNDENQHYYLAFQRSVSWHQANAFARRCVFQKRRGHLLTITSQTEQLFLVNTFGEISAWTAGSDETERGIWRWTDGPEEGQVYYRNDKPESGVFSNWGKDQPSPHLKHYMIWQHADENSEWRNADSRDGPEWLVVEFPLIE